MVHHPHPASPLTPWPIKFPVSVVTPSPQFLFTTAVFVSCSREIVTFVLYIFYLTTQWNMAFSKNFVWFYKTFPWICVRFWGFHGLPHDYCSVQHTFPKKGNVPCSGAFRPFSVFPTSRKVREKPAKPRKVNLPYSWCRSTEWPKAYAIQAKVLSQQTRLGITFHLPSSHLCCHGCILNLIRGTEVAMFTVDRDRWRWWWLCADDVAPELLC